jgi:hypothetical protein
MQKTSMYSINTFLICVWNTLGSMTLINTSLGFSLFPKLTLSNCSSIVTIQLVIFFIFDSDISSFIQY